MLKLDQAIVNFDRALRTLFAPAQSVRPVPGADLPEPPLEEQEKRLAGALMRVNHSGEICAQALYQGLGLSARETEARQALEQASREETEHLAWCEQRMRALGARKSLLNPLWYGASLALGAFAGAFGDRWNLGFLAETEHQVEGHLAGHLRRLPARDEKSRAVLEQMKADEARHAATALEHGGAGLPLPLKQAMKLASKAMTGIAFRV